ncbi:MAG TPA: DUF433 domain-containing protein [Planctomycetaceae bacterium]|jgi:uncharacterized protein (DUF433 family)
MSTTKSSIECTAGVCGGVPCVAGTRIPVWVLERSRQLGISREDVLDDYPTISDADLLAAWEYADSHRDEIASQIHENESG